MSHQVDLIAATAFGLESIAADELGRLGYKHKILGNGRVYFRADTAAICRANLWLRTADRVLLRLGAFPASDFGQLFDATTALPWEAWLPRDAAFPVSGRSIRSQLSSVPACQKIVKKAIVQRLLRAHGTEHLDEQGPLFAVEVALLENQATLTIDTTGPGLNKRGYRKLVGEAQLKETLAAGLVFLSPWGLAATRGPLLDPFCGTGTIPIEAAMFARSIAPGRLRQFAAEHWPAIAAKYWQEARQEAADLVLPSAGVSIVGSDRDEHALSLARYHARQAGVESDVKLTRRDFCDITPEDFPAPIKSAASSETADFAAGAGTLLCNPPYGERLGTPAEVAQLYGSMPEIFVRFSGWNINVLSSHPRFERLVSRPADKNRKLYNGAIECRYFQFAPGAFPASSQQPGTSSRRTRPSARPASTVSTADQPAKTNEQAALFRTRLLKRAQHLRRWAKRGIECYRLYDRDIPEIPLTVDRYADRLHIVEHERPHARSAKDHQAWLAGMARTAGEAASISPQQVFLKRRDPASGELLLPRPSGSDHRLVVDELGLKYRVNLADFVNTGLVLDRRQVRSLVRQQAAGKRVLDLFAYTGTYSVCALAGAAASVVAVDWFDSHRRWAEENFALNELMSRSPEYVVNDPLEFVRGHSRPRV